MAVVRISRKLDPASRARLFNICKEISVIFDEAQRTIVNHDKNSVALSKLLDEAAEIKRPTKDPDVFKLDGEAVFCEAFLSAVMNFMAAPRSADAPAERVAKFMAVFIPYLNYRDYEDSFNLTADDDPLIYREALVHEFINLLVAGFKASKAVIRYRVFQMLSETIKHFTKLSDSTYSTLQENLIERLDAKDTGIRAKVAACIAYLSTNKANNDKEEMQRLEAAFHRLLEMFEFDDRLLFFRTEVRKSILANLQVNNATLQHVLRRTRDVDVSVRKAVYTKIRKNVMIDAGLEVKAKGECHPTKLSVAWKVWILKHGLRDREPAVIRETEKLVDEWLSLYDTASVKPDPDDDPEAVARADYPLLCLLEDFEIASLDPESRNYVARMAKYIFKSNPKMFNDIAFGDKYWREIRPENAIIARSFVEYCRDNKIDAMLDDKLPTVASMAGLIRDHYRNLTDAYGSVESNNRIREYQEAGEAILSELLIIAALLDFSDHIGNQAMRDTITLMISENRLSDYPANLCVAILKSASRTERDFINIGVRLIRDLNPTNPTNDDEDTEREEQDEKAKNQLDLLNLRRLILFRSFLELLEGEYQKNGHLSHIIETLVAPTIKRADVSGSKPEQDDKDSPERIRHSLFVNAVLCSTLFALAVKVYQDLVGILKAKRFSGEIYVTLVKSIFDLVLMWEYSLFEGSEEKLSHEDIQTSLIDRIDSQEENPEALAYACQGLSKLVNTGFIKDLEGIVNLYKVSVLPFTAGNQGVRQSVDPFFIRFSGTPRGKQKLQESFIHTFESLSKERTRLGNPEDMVEPNTICEMFQTYLAVPLIDQLANTEEAKEVIENVDLKMAKHILEALFEREHKYNKDEKRALYKFLSKLNLRKTAHDVQIWGVKYLAKELSMCHPPSESMTQRNLQTFENNFAKTYAEQLEAMTDEEYAKLEDLQEIQDFVASIRPDIQNDLLDGDAGNRRCSLRSKRRFSTGASEDVDVKPDIADLSAKRHRLTSPEREPTEAGSSRSAMSTPAPAPLPNPPLTGTDRPPRPRPRPRKKPSLAPSEPREVIEISSDSDEEVPPPKSTRTRLPEPLEVKEEEPEDANRAISNLLGPRANETYDSIMDSTRTDSIMDSTRMTDSIMDPSLAPPDSDDSDADDVLDGLQYYDSSESE
ncbi:hypothetical protein FA15DRAFT_714661 [Coprinopsis marcescibilis]|uniref:Nuclear condensin complex subunit 3 C-terminal domain-containing protein n=1 Tax=Coprinopsis marcescibilis TaxID=230819 RepID=A0A5C3L1N1_COPMA|nr:hypothetical protein FA15DRAFT_714661 [Coprinopsis marcescibilis]